MIGFMMSVSGIYRINGPNGKFYVGSAKNIGRRWIVHKRDLRKGNHANLKLQRSWNRHGESVFRIEILEVVSVIADLIEREQFWIDSLGAVKNGYNILPTAGSHLGKKHSDETRRKMSAAKIGRKHGPMREEQKAYFSSLYRGRKLSDETCRRMSESRMGRKFSDETRLRISEALKGKSKSEAHCIALSVAKSGKKHSDETRMKMRVAHLRRRREFIQPIL